MIDETTVGGFLESVASSSATPGGGSVGAVAAATGAALIEMVVHLSEGKEGLEASAADLARIGASASEARHELLELADRDSEAFDSVMAAFRLPKGTDDERASRSSAIQAAFVGAAQVPMEVARRGADLLDLAVEAIVVGNPDAASDGLSGAATCHAGVVCALANVRINAASIKDAAVADGLRTEADALHVRARARLDAAEAAFSARVGP